MFASPGIHVNSHGFTTIGLPVETRRLQHARCEGSDIESHYLVVGMVVQPRATAQTLTLPTQSDAPRTPFRVCPIGTLGVEAEERHRVQRVLLLVALLTSGTVSGFFGGSGTSAIVVFALH